MHASARADLRRPPLWIKSCGLAQVVLCAAAASGPSYINDVGWIHDVPADGDCLFSAVALAWTDAESRQRSVLFHRPDKHRLAEAAASLRRKAVKFLCPAPAKVPDPDRSVGGLPIAMIVEPLDGEDGAGYCRRMARRGEWGTSAEVIALAHVTGHQIVVHSDFAPAGDAYGEAGKKKQAALHVHLAGSHYRAVLPGHAPGKDEL